ncbi:hypothetical protein LTR08_008872 [Meristemomyces frigidus]|nr:hypothetical protein LTR08_008872 [Meristemomyces frigidus]
MTSSSVKDVEAVKRTLQLPDGQPPKLVVNDIGGAPKLQWSLLQPVTLEDPKICQDAGATSLRAL